jgi:hypothetical protein
MIKLGHFPLRRSDIDEAFTHNGHLKVFNHHVYEYRKGLRNLALQTLPCDHEGWISSRLDRLGIDYLIYPIGKQNINVFLGDSECLEIIRQIGKFKLSHYTPEEDFILGTMLGYGRHQQCIRYLSLTKQANNNEPCPSDTGDFRNGEQVTNESEVYS